MEARSSSVAKRSVGTCSKGVTKVTPVSSRTLKWRASISASTIFGGRFISGVDEGKIFAHKAENVIYFMLGETGVPCHLDGRFDPDFTLASLAPNMNVSALRQVETIKSDPVGAVRNGNARHRERLSATPGRVNPA